MGTNQIEKIEITCLLKTAEKLLFFYDIKCEITKVIEEQLKANKFVSVVRLMNDEDLKDLVFKSAKYTLKYDGEMPTQKEIKQACAYLACTIINTAKDNLNLN